MFFQALNPTYARSNVVHVKQGDEWTVDPSTIMLAGQKWKDKWRGGVGYSNRNIIIIRRDGSGTVVPIRMPVA